MSSRVLFVSYAFPPVGGAGVQRVAKWLKYLPASGWRSSVLTVANPSVPLFDDSLCADIPVDTVVCRARTFEPGYRSKSKLTSTSDVDASPSLLRQLRRNAAFLARLTLQPDPQILWAPAAYRAGRALLGETPHDVIVATGPPFSALLIGSWLSRASGVPLVLDYRDEWGISREYLENRHSSRLTELLQNMLEGVAVRQASVVLATTRRSTEAVRARSERLGSRARFACIYNGYDPTDFPPPQLQPEVRAGRCTVAYVGTLWNLTDVRPLVEGALMLCREDPARAARLDLVFAGRRTNEQDRQLARLKDTCVSLRVEPYLDHGQAVALMRTASSLCLLLAPGPEAARVVPAKLFEYMAARRPILAIVPEGEVRDLLIGHPAVEYARPDRPAEVMAALANCVDRGEAHVEAWASAEWDPAVHSRPRQAEQLAAVLAAARRPVAPPTVAC